jgi:predicted metal-dependent hydrolase
MKNLDIEYRVSPRRRSIGIQVTAEGKVVVNLPRGATQATLARALEKHRIWIERRVAERQAAWEQLKEGRPTSWDSLTASRRAGRRGEPYP